MMPAITSSDAFEPISTRISPREMDTVEDKANVSRKSRDEIQGEPISDVCELSIDGRLG